jgi:hypothetical protein
MADDLACHILVSVCLLASGLQETEQCKSVLLPSLVDTPQSQFKSRSTEGKVGNFKSLQVVFFSHII